MKIRNGFVSNSSSSSFVIVVKKGELTQDKIERAFEGAKNTPFGELVEGVVYQLYNTGEWEMDSCYESLDDWIDDYGHYEENDLIYESVKKGLKVYQGFAEDYGGDIAEMVLCAAEINYEDEDIIIKKESYY